MIEIVKYIKTDKLSYLINPDTRKKTEFAYCKIKFNFAKEYFDCIMDILDDEILFLKEIKEIRTFENNACVGNSNDNIFEYNILKNFKHAIGFNRTDPNENFDDHYINMNYYNIVDFKNYNKIPNRIFKNKLVNPILIDNKPVEFEEDCIKIGCYTVSNEKVNLIYNKIHNKNEESTS